MEKIKLPRPESLRACPDYGDYVQKICDHLAELYDVIEKNSDAYSEEDRNTLKKTADRLHYYLDCVHIPYTVVFSSNDIANNEYVLVDLTEEDANILVEQLQTNKPDLTGIFKYASEYSNGAQNHYGDDMLEGLREAVKEYAKSMKTS